MDAASSGLGGAGGAAKMDVLAQTLKLSDLDFDQFEPEPSLIQDNQTQVSFAEHAERPNC